MKSRYEQLSKPQAPERKWDRYGLSEREWLDLTSEQREIHYNRWRVACDHPYVWTDDPVYGDTLREAHSYDPYLYTTHDNDIHTPQKFFAGTCECNNCRHNVGLERGSPFEYNKRKHQPIPTTLVCLVIIAPLMFR